jgi:hypothetical protein
MVWLVVRSTNVTFPVGTKAPLPVTVAVIAPDWPNALGFCDDASVVVEFAVLTI